MRRSCITDGGGGNGSLFGVGLRLASVTLDRGDGVRSFLWPFSWLVPRPGGDVEAESEEGWSGCGSLVAVATTDGQELDGVVTAVEASEAKSREDADEDDSEGVEAVVAAAAVAVVAYENGNLI